MEFPPPAGQPPPEDDSGEQRQDPSGDNDSPEASPPQSGSGPANDPPPNNSEDVPTLPKEGTAPPTGDDFFGPLDDLADPDIFNPAVSSKYGQECVRHGSGSGGPADDDSELIIRKELARIAAEIARKKVPAMLGAAAAIRDLRKRSSGSPSLQRHISELVAIWRLIRQEMERKAPCHIDFGLRYDATELMEPGVVIPSRSAQLGGRQDPLPEGEELRRWLDDVFRDEASLRQFCCFAFQENEPGIRREALIWFNGVAVPGAAVAALYWQGQMRRPWDPKRDPESALLHDFILATTVIGKGHWTTKVAQQSLPRLRPFLRSIPDEMLMPAGASATGFLEGRGLIYQSGPRTWRISPPGFKVFDANIGPVWLAAARK